MSKPLSETWADVTCPTCRARLEESDHPADRYRCGGYAYTNAGHAVFYDQKKGVLLLCRADAWVLPVSKK